MPGIRRHSVWSVCLVGHCVSAWRQGQPRRQVRRTRRAVPAARPRRARRTSDHPRHAGASLRRQGGSPRLMEGSQRDRPRCAAAEPCACLAAMEGAATVDYSRAEVAKGKDALIEWRTHNGSACIQTLEAPAVPPDQRLGSARIGGARENDPGADLGAV